MGTTNGDDEHTDSTYLVRNLYSEQELKKVTQDYICEKIRDQNISENVQYSNIRIILSLMLILIGSYCTIFVQYKKEPLFMIKLLVTFFIISVILFIWEYLFFEDTFMILKTNNGGTVMLFFELDIHKNSLRLAYKLNKQVHGTFFELRKLFNENGYLVEQYADSTLKKFISDHGGIFKLNDNKKKA
ncbi:signal peptidase complex subunit 2 [Plasmodium gonderi]|uniref:Signal peptidase complex subunit 2 n=1 Tax=Plasmodium gonderi TaxID=77519 RepID=A0A1Y1JHC5_PLAGO|nr:signal peptidase complex subunit 2 [Plasmodium gonderi]GAW80617.1 signal peptidase complex subunit 2 [Plasmodium gonderi]